MRYIVRAFGAEAEIFSQSKFYQNFRKHYQHTAPTGQIVEVAELAFEAPSKTALTDNLERLAGGKAAFKFFNYLPRFK